MSHLQEGKLETKIEIHGVENYSINSYLHHCKNIFTAIQSADYFLANALEVGIECQHDLDKKSAFSMPSINLRYSVNTRASENACNVINQYLNEGRKLLFSTNYDNRDNIEELIVKINEKCIEVNVALNDQKYLFHDKVINRVELAKIIEIITSVKAFRNDEYACKITCDNNIYSIKSFEKIKALDLLGGKFVDEKSFTANFVVFDIPFGNIENKAKFTLDGSIVTVFIADKAWIEKFNNRQISLTKDQPIKAVTKIERSPLTKNPIAYYFVSIKDHRLS